MAWYKVMYSTGPKGLEKLIIIAASIDIHQQSHYNKMRRQHFFALKKGERQVKFQLALSNFRPFDRFRSGYLTNSDVFLSRISLFNEILYNFDINGSLCFVSVPLLPQDSFEAKGDRKKNILKRNGNKPNLSWAETI